MDLSKLPKLSNTPDDPDTAAARRRPGDAPPDEGDGLYFFDIFLMVGVGLLFLFLGKTYGTYLFSGTSPYDESTATKIFWTDGPKQGQEVLPEELNDTSKVTYALRLTQRISDSATYLFGAGMLVAGVLGVVTRVRFVPLPVRLATAAIGFLLIGSAVIYNVYVAAKLLGANITPLISIIAILVGGMTLFVQWAVVQYLLQAAKTAPIGPSRSQREIDALPKPRGASPMERVHQRFAHQSLRLKAIESPAGVVGLLQGPSAQRTLNEIWSDTCAAIGLSPEHAPAIGLEAEMTQVGPYSAAVVTMPPPTADGHAYFIGLVLRSIQRADGSIVERRPLLLYYTLEHTGNTTQASLCEWQAGDHVRFADKLAPNLSAFRDAMWQKVQSRQASEDAGKM